MAPRFCPRCHRQVVLPEFVRSGKVVAKNGVALQCGNCGKGKVVLRQADLPVAV